MSKAFVVRYTTRPDAADENQRLVEQVYAQLAEETPANLRYVTFRLADGVTFVHIAENDGEDSPLPRLSAFKEFLRELADRVVEAPNSMDATVIGSYRFTVERPATDHADHADHAESAG